MIHFGVIAMGRVTPLCDAWSGSFDWTTARAAVTCPVCGGRCDHGVAASSLSPVARMVLVALEGAPGTPDELGRATHLPPRLVDAALVELRNAGCAEEPTPRLFRAR